MFKVLWCGKTAVATTLVIRKAIEAYRYSEFPECVEFIDEGLDGLF